MVKAGPWQITNFKPLGDKWRFTVVLNTAMGPVYMSGWTLWPDRSLRAPCVHAGKAWVPIIKINDNTRSLLHKLADRAELEYAKHEALQAAPDRTLP